MTDTQTKPHTPEQTSQNPEELILLLEKIDKEPVELFAPSDGDTKKTEFLSGDQTVWPRKNYDKLAQVDFAERLDGIAQIREQMAAADFARADFRKAYLAYVDNIFNVNYMMQQALIFDTTNDENARKTAADEFMKTNIELYGAPDRETYQGLLADKLRAIRDKDLSGEAAELREHLLAQFPDLNLEDSAPVYAPQPETVAWAHEAAKTLFQPLVDHIPKAEPDHEFTPVEIQNIFTEIIRDEFDEEVVDNANNRANGSTVWVVEVNPNKTGLDVSPRERKISIPEKRSSGNPNRADLETLIVHELGAHFMRSVIGEQSNLPLLRTGLNGYYTSEEGLGAVLEQAWKGEYSAPLPWAYLISGMSYFDGKSPAETFALLKMVRELTIAESGTSEIDEATETKVADFIYRNCQRIFRGTDALPMFKDLAYFNGRTKIWQYMDSICGDTERLTDMFSGKLDPTNDNDLKILRETTPNPDGVPEPDPELNRLEKLQLRQIAGKFVVDRALLKRIANK